MANRSRSGGAIFQVIFWLLIIVLLIGAIMYVRKLSNNFTEDIQTFYLVVDGEIITDHTTKVSLLNEKIEVHNLSLEQGFTYKIEGKSNRNFFFNVNGVEHAFEDIGDCTEYFDVQTTNREIKISSIGMLDVLNAIYDADVELPHLEDDVCYFTLTVTSADGSKSIRLEFFVKVPPSDIPADGIVIDTLQVVF